MNKKFSTLMAGLLLAGGLFSSVNALDLTKAEAGRYYQINQVADWTSAGWGNAFAAGGNSYVWVYNESSKQVELAQNVTGDNSYWRIDAVNGKEGYYTLTDKKGHKFSVSVGDATISEFKLTYDGAVFDKTALSFVVGETTYYVACTAASAPYTLVASTDKARGFDAKAVASTAYTADQLNAFLGGSVGFKMTIGYLKDNKADQYTAYEGLDGNPFDGVLYAEALASNGYKLRKGGKDGDIIVLLNDNYNKQNADVIAGVNGYKFTTMTPAEFNLQVARDNAQTDASKKVINSYAFNISQQVGSEDLEVAVGGGMELIVSKFGTQTVLTTAASESDGEASYNNATNKTYVRLGGNNLVDMTKFAAQVYYSFINEDGEVAGANCSTSKTAIADYLSKYAQVNMPEGQWVLTSVDASEATFTNRESLQTFKIALNSFYNTDVVGVYEIAGVKYTIKTIAMADADKGYADFGNTTLKQYTIGVYSPDVWKGVANFVENHASAAHQIGLSTEDATVWTLEPNAAEAKFSEITDKKTEETDSVYVINHYVLWNAAAKKYDLKKDTLKIVSYKIKNASNGEYIAYADAAKEKFYTCDPAKATKSFAFKKVGDSYNMVEVVLHDGLTAAKIKGGKVSGGESATKGLLDKVSCIYDRVENDLVKVQPADINLYRRIQNGMDTISIYRAENASQLLFEKETFLSWANDNQFDFAPAMLADTAYVEEGAIRPQYMLVVGKPISVTKGTQELCPICGEAECGHSSATYDTVEGRYLVNLKDSAIAFDAKNIHAVNPYMNTEKYYRLGFVPAKRVNKTLTIASTGKELNIGTPDYNEAKFAFKYVDEAAGTFKIETADFAREDKGTVKRGDMLKTPGYLKTMNGVIVVVSDEADADIFNMNENESSNPTANENIATSSVAVAGVDGAIVVKGAEGKNVIVSTILGKVVANEVVSSDNATIAAPAGIVVVSVDGESFKVVVK